MLATPYAHVNILDIEKITKLISYKLSVAQRCLVLSKFGISCVYECGIAMCFNQARGQKTWVPVIHILYSFYILRSEDMSSITFYEFVTFDFYLREEGSHVRLMSMSMSCKCLAWSLPSTKLSAEAWFKCRGYKHKIQFKTEFRNC